jgi:hypothetical protein
MDCKDLMIGDLVNVNGLNLKVGAIHADEIGVFDPDFKIYWCSDDGLDRIDPIPLTEEILVKNGWRKESITIDGDYANWHGEIPVCQEEEEFNYERVELTYVHQLQHLLRLCGIEKEIEL